jgi:hypothetical protein
MMRTTARITTKAPTPTPTPMPILAPMPRPVGVKGKGVWSGVLGQCMRMYA